MIFFVLFALACIVGCGTLAYEAWEDDDLLKFLFLLVLIIFFGGFLKAGIAHVMDDDDCGSEYTKTRVIETNSSRLIFENEVCVLKASIEN